MNDPLSHSAMNTLDSSRPTFAFLNNDVSAESDSGVDTMPADTAVAGTAVSAEEVSQAAATPAQFTHREMADLRGQVTRRARTAASAEPLAAWLVKQGVSENEAERMATRAWTSAQSAKKAAVAQRRQDVGLAWAEIIGGVVLLIAGLAAGWFVGLFLVPIVDGFRRLGS